MAGWQQYTDQRATSQNRNICRTNKTQQYENSSCGSYKPPGHYTVPGHKACNTLIKKPTDQLFENSILLNIQKLNTSVENCHFISNK